MKFGKEIEDELVPEWREKYFDYKQAKKRLKAVTRAVRKKPYVIPEARPFKAPDTPSLGSVPVPVPRGEATEEYEPLTGDGIPSRRTYARVGSIVSSPPSLNLPQPALGDDEVSTYASSTTSTPTPTPTKPLRSPGGREDVIGSTTKDLQVVKRRHSHPEGPRSHYGSIPKDLRPFMRRLFSRSFSRSFSGQSESDVPLEVMKEIDIAQAKFWTFLENELEKVEGFYKEMEDRGTGRLEILREQLHAMRDQRLAEIAAAKELKSRNGVHNHMEMLGIAGSAQTAHNERKRFPHVPSSLNAVYHPIQTVKRVHFHNSTRSHQPNVPPFQPSTPQTDYVRRPTVYQPPYIAAKSKLKIALQEFYRGLELLKSYAILNRTAFRKINKKYDKAVEAHPKMRFMSEKVNDAWFVKSDVVDGHLHAVEDLYARYFEKGNHKIAVGKLRKSGHGGNYAGSTWRNGLLTGAGIVLTIEALVYSEELLYHPDGRISLHTSYLLQIYAGYFLLLLHFLFFCINCKIFTLNKINYPFVFEFDTRHNLDWRQLAEIPSLLLFLLGLVMWLNFNRIGGATMYLYYPIILIGITAVILFLPLPILYHRSRRWFAYSLWRLIPAGLYAVEFRDFFLGDMFCSQTYSMGNIELFFCLYATDWRNPTDCNSSHSRLLGFFSTLPGIWRALQCLRRYYDTRQWFPHLVNCGKYMFTILATMSLSMYRINSTEPLLALFITLAFINSVYTSSWDLAVDWSLMNPYAKHKFLRNTLAYKQTWFYYAAIVIDPILRFNWIFYVAILGDLQHSSLASFFIALSEVCRRAIWTVIRVENEHCNNIKMFKASRDVPLPYEFINDRTDLADDLEATAALAHVSSASGSSLHNKDSAASSLRRRQGGHRAAGGQSPASIRARVGTFLEGAHAKDFERRRPSDVLGRGGGDEAEDSDEEDLEVVHEIVQP